MSHSIEADVARLQVSSQAHAVRYKTDDIEKILGEWERAKRQYYSDQFLIQQDQEECGYEYFIPPFPTFQTWCVDHAYCTRLR